LAVALGLCVQQRSGLLPVRTDKQNLLTYYDDAHMVRAVRTRVDWEIRHAQIIFNMLRVMGPLPKASILSLDVRPGSLLLEKQRID